MNEFSKTYLSLIYEWNQKMVDDQNKRIINHLKPKELYDSSSRHLDLIWEATYFDDIDDVFEGWFVKQFDMFREDCIEKAKSGKEYDLEMKLAISDIAKHLPLSKLKDYKNFHQFINLLKSSRGTLTLSLTDGSSCYEPPIEWIGQRIQIEDRRHDLFNEPIDKAGELYKNYMLQLTSKCKTLSEKYSKIKESILQQEDFGHIKINFKFFTDERNEFKNSAFTHEFGHFLDFLIKINAENWDIGRQYRSHKVHSDFNPDNLDDKLSYFLDETEFKRLAATYIEHLKLLFKRTSCDLKKFLEAAMILFEIDVHYAKGTTAEELKDCMTTISTHFYFNDMKDFFKAVYEDSKSEEENVGTRDRWTILKKWMWRELSSK